MQALLTKIKMRLQAGSRVMLCTVLQTEGSAPRGAGAKMAVFADGSILGTVGGGAMEHLAIVRAGELLREGRSGTHRWSLTPGGVESAGTVCGGTALVGFACLEPSDAPLLDAWLTALDRDAWLKTTYRGDGVALELIVGEDLHGEGERLPKSPVLTAGETETVFLEPVARRFTAWVFGGGHVGAALVPILAAVGFPVTVYDERPEIAVPARFPQARRVICGAFADLSGIVQIAPEDYVVVLTPGHREDTTVLRQVLRTGATYIGCIGSRKKVAVVNQTLKAEGFSDGDLARIHSPIGLPIGAQTPEEIAVSITAQMILHRHGGNA